MIFMFFMVLVAIVVLGASVVGFVTLRDRRIKTLSDENFELRRNRVETNKSLNEAHRALNKIAGGSGSPALEAQIVLDNYNSKEIA